MTTHPLDRLRGTFLSTTFMTCWLWMSVFTGCEPLSLGIDDLVGEAPLFRAESIEDPESDGRQLRVMTWNIKYGSLRAPFWFDCWGDQVSMSVQQVEQNMEALYALIREADPDVLVVQEIELHSRRSAYYNMIQGILDHTSLNYGSYYESWHSRYIPSEGLGRMSLGNAIFSKYKIVASEAVKLPKRTDLDQITETFYLNRTLGRAELELGDGTRVATYVVHTEAYDEDGTKARQIKQIFEKLSEEQLPFMIGGDFNELPPTAVKVASFPDERDSAVCGEDFDQPPYTPEVMADYYVALNPWIGLDRYGTDEFQQQRYYTHTVLGPDEVNEVGEQGDWNRTLDYLFVSSDTDWVVGTTDVLQYKGQKVGSPDETGSFVLDWTLDADPIHLSDHAPAFGIWEVAP